MRRKNILALADEMEDITVPLSEALYKLRMALLGLRKTLIREAPFPRRTSHRPAALASTPTSAVNHFP